MIKTVLNIDGMKCEHCEVRVNQMIQVNFDVKKVTSSAATGETIIISEKEIDAEFMKRVLKAVGYELKSSDSGLHEKAGILLFGM